MLALLLSPAFVVAINNPLMWQSLDNQTGPAAAIGLSGYAGISSHQALRLNYATYEVDNGPAVAEGLAGGGDGSCAFVVSGHSEDVGAGWMYFSRERWRGPSLELGAVRKDLHLARCHNDGDEYKSTTRTTSTAYVARATLAWSWLFSDHIFVSFAGGASIGREAGFHDEDHAHYQKLAAYPEMYFRLGFAFM